MPQLPGISKPRTPLGQLVNRLPRTAIPIAAAALYMALCSGVAGAAAGSAMLPRGGPLPPMPTPPPVPPKAASAPAVHTPQSPVAQPASPSLAKLAALALPGVAGLAALTGTGGYLGYRQAKAGFALRAAGTARFLP
jgi:hypothetical protein